MYKYFKWNKLTILYLFLLIIPFLFGCSEPYEKVVDCLYQRSHSKEDSEYSSCKITYQEKSGLAKLSFISQTGSLKDLVMTWDFAESDEWKIGSESARLVESGERECVQTREVVSRICWWRKKEGIQAPFEDSNYVFAMFTINPPMPSTLTTEILAYHEDIISEDFPEIPLSPPIASQDFRWNSGADPEEPNIVQVGKIQFYRNFPVIGMLLQEKNIYTVANLLNARHVFRLSRANIESYTYFMRGVDEIVEEIALEEREKPESINISAQAPIPYTFYVDEPWGMATRALYEREIVTVVAAGNFGDITENVMNPWAISPWVISVGAASEDGKSLWSGSSKGIPGHPSYHPTVVAPAESTSLAAPIVSAIAGHCVFFINDLYSSAEGQRMKNMAASLDIEFVVSSHPYFVKRMIEDMAREMPGYEEYQVGAGFIDPEEYEQYFDSFDFENFRNVFEVEKSMVKR